MSLSLMSPQFAGRFQFTNVDGVRAQMILQEAARMNPRDGKGERIAVSGLVHSHQDGQDEFALQLHVPDRRDRELTATLQGSCLADKYQRVGGYDASKLPDVKEDALSEDHPVRAKVLAAAEAVLSQDPMLQLLSALRGLGASNDDRGPKVRIFFLR